MKRTRTRYLVFTATVILFQQLIRLHRDCLNNLTKTILKACKLLSAGNFKKQLIPVQAPGMVIIPPDKKVQTTEQHNSQEIQSKSTPNNHRMKGADPPLVRAQKVHIQPDAIACCGKAMQYATKLTLLALWVYAVFRRTSTISTQKTKAVFR